MQHFAKDEIICREVPLVSLQTMDNAKVVLCCANCAVFLGNWCTQAQMIVGDQKKTRAYSYKKGCVEDLLVTNRVQSCAGRKRTACFQHYCSNNCRWTALWSNHALECRCGEGEDFPTGKLMGEFLAHAGKTEEIFLAVGRVICTMIMHILRDAVGRDQLLTKPVDSVADVLEWFAWLEEQSESNKQVADSVQVTAKQAVEWFETSFPASPLPTQDAMCSAGTTEHSAEAELRDAACESWLLLHSALLEKGVSRALFGALLNKRFFGTVLRACECYLHSVSVTVNPLLAHLVDYLANRNTQHTGYRNAPEEVFLKDLLVSSDESQRDELLSNKLLLISELNALSSGSDSVASATGHDKGIFTFDSRACNSSFMVLLPYCSRVSHHSCVPSAHITAGAASSLDRPDRLVVDLPPLNDTYKQQCRKDSETNKALRIDISALRASNIGTRAENLSISYVDDSVLGGANDLESRQAQLITRFPALCGTSCRCTRCVFEGACSINQDLSAAPNTRPSPLDEVLAAFTVEELLYVGHTCMQQHAHDDAKLLYTTLLERLCGKALATLLADIQNDRPTNDDKPTDAGTQTITDARLAQTAGDAFHALGAAYLESNGDWERARRVWKVGAKIAPLHSQLAAEVGKVQCYPPAAVRVQPCASVRLTAAEVKGLVEADTEQYSFRRAWQPSTVPIESFDAQTLGVHYDVCSTAKDRDALKRVVGIPPFLGFPAAITDPPTLPPAPSQVFLTSHQQQLLTASECRYVINTTETFAAMSGGWSTSRHYAVPTTDIPVHIIKSSESLANTSIPSSTTGGSPANLLEWFNEIFTNRLAPLLASQYQGSFASGEPIRVAIHDAFVVKYEATPAQDLCDTALSDNDVALGSASPARKLAGQRYLPLHCDQSSHSFTISLNPSGDYIGGGTYFPAMGTVLRPDCGQVLSFPGGTVLHGGEPISSGTRYILAVFAYLAGHPGPLPATANADTSHVVDCALINGEPLHTFLSSENNRKRQLDQTGELPAKQIAKPTVASSFHNVAAPETQGVEKVHTFNFMF